MSHLSAFQRAGPSLSNAARGPLASRQAMMVASRRVPLVCTRSLHSPVSSCLSKPCQFKLPRKVSSPVLCQARWNSSKTSSPPSQQSSDSPAKAASATTSSQPTSAVQRLIAKLRDALLQSLSKAASRSGTGSGAQDTIAPPTYPDFRRLFSLAGPERKTLILALSLLLVSSAVSLAVPFTIGKVIDFFTASSAPAEGKDAADGTATSGEKKIFGLGFKSMVGVLVFVFATGAAAKAGSNIMLNLAGVRIVKRIREKCFGNAIKQEVEWADKSHGDIISRLSVDTSIVGDAVTYELGDGLRSTLTVLFSGTTMFLISPSLTLLMMGVVPPAAIGAVFYGRYLRDLTNKTQEAVGEMTKTAEERLNSQAFRTVTAFNAQKIEERRFAEKVQKIADIETKETYASGFFYAGTGFVGNCSILVLLTYGGTLVSRGVITVGDLTSLLMYTAYLGGGLANMTSFFASIMKGVGAGARVFSLMDRESEVKLSEGRALTAVEKAGGPIEFRDVHFEYPSRPGVKVLDGVNITIQKGESVALVGGSGVGKSSVHSLMLRYYDPSSGGQILYAGAPISEYNPSELRDQIAVVTQDPILFTGTLFENIAYGCEPPSSREHVIEAAKQANCWEFIQQLPGGLDEEIGARQLSGGQRQRVAIARALCRRPKVLLLDEATSALDSASEYLVNQSISDIIKKGEITVWIVAHRLSTIKSANRIMVLENGKIVENGSFDELDQPGSAFRKLVGSQIERDDEGESTSTDESSLGSFSSSSPLRSSSSQSRGFHTSARLHKTPKPSLSYNTPDGSPSSYKPRHSSIPASPTWSIRSILPDSSHTFTTEELLKLHKLAALEPPDAEGLKKLKESMAESKQLIDAVQDSVRSGDDGKSSLGEKTKLHDGRVTSESERFVVGETVYADSRMAGMGVMDKAELLSKAGKTQGGYFVVERQKREHRDE